MIYLPGFGVTYRLPVAKWAYVNIRLWRLCADAALSHIESVAAHASMVDSPGFGVT